MSTENQNEVVMSDGASHNSNASATPTQMESTERVVAIPSQSEAPAATPAAQSCGTPACQKKFIYAIGTIGVRFPNQGVEKEFRQVAAAMDNSEITHDSITYNVLKKHRNLAREVCWIFTIEGIDTYILLPSAPEYIKDLIEAINPAKTNIIQHVNDIDAIIGTKGPLAAPEMCNGLSIPIVAVDSIYSFDLKSFSEALPKNAKSTKELDGLIGSVFMKVIQMADNTGELDEHRAINYLTLRYKDIYECVQNMHDKKYYFVGMYVIPSRLRGSRKLLNVILDFSHKENESKEKYYIRVDVTDKYPFLANKISQFFEREYAY
jgi:hypothetical protein